MRVRVRACIRVCVRACITNSHCVQAMDTPGSRGRDVRQDELYFTSQCLTDLNLDASSAVNTEERLRCGVSTDPSGLGSA